MHEEDIRQKNDIVKLTIGSLTLANRFLLAPLAGITDIAFRSIASEMGAALVCTEMISAKALDQNNRHTHELLAYRESERPVAVQLFGHEPDVMARAAADMEERGFDLIDINMGCPVPKVFKNGDGSALLKDPALAAEIVRAVKGAASIPVTVKMRIGFEGADGEASHARFAAEFAARMEEAGADAITVHGRTREQYYSGTVHLDAIAAVKKAVSVPVIGNGDITDPASAREMFARTGCDGLMIGRAAIGNPWIFRQFSMAEITGQLAAAEITGQFAAAEFAGRMGEDNAEDRQNATTAQMAVGGVCDSADPDIECFAPTPEERAQMLLEQARRSCEVHGEKMGIVRMRGIGGWYFKGMRNAARMRDRIHSVSTMGELEEVVRDILQDMTDDE